MIERSQLIAYLRGEMVGPSAPIGAPHVIEFQDNMFRESDLRRSGALAWLPQADGVEQEVIYYDRESPH